MSLGDKQLLDSCHLLHAASLASSPSPASNQKRYPADRLTPEPSKKPANGQRPHMEFVIKDSDALQSRTASSITRLICKQNGSTVPGFCKR